MVVWLRSNIFCVIEMTSPSTQRSLCTTRALRWQRVPAYDVPAYATQTKAEMLWAYCVTLCLIKWLWSLLRPLKPRCAHSKVYLWFSLIASPTVFFLVCLLSLIAKPIGCTSSLAMSHICILTLPSDECPTQIQLWPQWFGAASCNLKSANSKICGSS